jgi:ABC-type multidrug transport system permease subunit
LSLLLLQSIIADLLLSRLCPSNRDIFEAREKKARFYSWQVFVFGEIIAEVPYLFFCAFIYWACWYAVVGFSFRADIAGPVYLQMTLYEFLYVSSSFLPIFPLSLADGSTC